MELTVEQVIEAAGKQPDLKTGLLSSLKEDFIKTPPENVVIRTKDEDQKFLDSHVNTVVEERVSKQLQPKVDEEFSKMLTKIDQHVEAITGVKKTAGEKTFDFAKRAIEEKKTQGGDPVTKERVKQLEDSLSTMKSEYEKKIADTEGKLFSKEIDWQMNGELDKVSIALPVHLKTDQEKQGYINQQKALIKQGFLSSYQPKKDDQGNIVYYKDDQPQLSLKDGKALTAGELIGRDYSAWFVPAGHVQTGTGTGSGNGQGALIPSGGFKDKESIHKFLAASGIEEGSKKYMEEFQRLASEAKIAI
jgi:hypothetical protein